MRAGGVNRSLARLKKTVSQKTRLSGRRSFHQGDRAVSRRLTWINADAGRFGQKSVMPEAIRIELAELAELREKAALLCDETKGLIEDYHRLRNWRNESAAATVTDRAADRSAKLPILSARSD